ncbi:MAG: imidazole glycerol phosphate synthase subunit HisH, partial [Phycisphaerae bacterium]
MIVIVDYGMGNLRSVQKALERVGGEARVSDRAEDVARAERLVVPGVGAFGDAMRALG